MPQVITATRYDYGEFDDLAIGRLGLMKDWTCIAAAEWNNYEDHQMTAEHPDTFKYDTDRDSLADLYRAIAAYQQILALNKGVDPWIGYSREGRDAPVAKVIQEARKTLWNETRAIDTVAAALVKAGAMEPGEIIIHVFW
jgi:hypothetical protein